MLLFDRVERKTENVFILARPFVKWKILAAMKWDLYILLSGLLFVLSMSCGWSEVTMEDVKNYLNSVKQEDK